MAESPTRRRLLRLAQLTLVGSEDASPSYRPTGEPLPIPDTRLASVSEEGWPSI